MHPQRDPVGPGEESVWDYPRPPRLERVGERIRIEFAGETIANSARGWRVLETASPPTYYLPRADVRMDLLERASGSSVCEWKGSAEYWTIRVGDREAKSAVWSYPNPTPDFEPIRDHLAFYASRVDACWIGDERVTPQPGRFYGGWITKKIKGPFKGEPGSEWW